MSKHHKDAPVIDTTPPPRQRAQTATQRAKARARRLMWMTADLMREQGGECYWCGIAMWHPQVDNPDYTTDHPSGRDPEDRATFDHKVPCSQGGLDLKDNGVAACKNCNQHRGNISFEEYGRWDGKTPISQK